MESVGWDLSRPPVTCGQHTSSSCLEGFIPVFQSQAGHVKRFCIGKRAHFWDEIADKRTKGNRLSATRLM